MCTLEKACHYLTSACDNEVSAKTPERLYEAAVSNHRGPRKPSQFLSSSPIICKVLMDPPQCTRG